MNRKVIVIYICSVLTIVGIIFATYSFSGQTVQKGIGEPQSYEVWNSVMANQINKESIQLTVDGKDIDTNDVYMSENMELMIPSDIVVDAFNCSNNLYKNEELVLEKGSNKATIQVGKKQIVFNDKKDKLKEKTVQKEGKIYLPISLFCQYFGYGYEWDRYTNSAKMKDDLSAASFLPERYSYLEKGRVFETKDQGKYGTCWAFATLSALESTLLPEEKFDFSEDNLVHNNALSEEVQDGGDYVLSMAYLTAWKGPVLERDDPYGDDKTDNSLKPIKHVQEIQIIEEKDYNQIKEMIFKYGGVESSMYMTMDNSDSNSVNYNRETYAYCYKGKAKPNHDVVIIGWDDNYPKESFNDTTIKENGAFICKNSWGSRFGDDGVFYISYEDDCIGTHSVCYTKVGNTTNFDNIYQSDLCGWTGTMGFKNKNTVYFANVFTANKDEVLSAVGFYATATDLSYEVFVCEDYTDKESLNNRNHIAATGKLKNKGYYTISLDNSYNIKENEKFAIIVKISKENDKGTVKLVPVEMNSGTYKNKVDLTDGEGYFSSVGYNWQSAEKQNCNICLKAYTNNQ